MHTHTYTIPDASVSATSKLYDLSTQHLALSTQHSALSAIALSELNYRRPRRCINTCE